MNFTGKIIHISDARSGTSATSGKPWTCRDYVIEDASQRFPARVCFTVFGEDRLREFDIHPGETLTVSFDIDAREHNGRWFNSVQAFAVARPQAAPAQPAAYVAPPVQRGAVFAAQAQQQPAAPPPAQPDLPF